MKNHRGSAICTANPQTFWSDSKMLQESTTKKLNWQAMIWTPPKQIDQQEETKPAAAKTNVLTGSLSQ
jgi:hypothetical protein